MTLEGLPQTLNLVRFIILTSRWSSISELDALKVCTRLSCNLCDKFLLVLGHFRLKSLEEFVDVHVPAAHSDYQFPVHDLREDLLRAVHVVAFSKPLHRDEESTLVDVLSHHLVNRVSLKGNVLLPRLVRLAECILNVPLPLILALFLSLFLNGH